MPKDRDWLGDYAMVGGIVGLLIGIVLAVLLS
jgi:tetrahydromethanopterin S-methyltransferase subunit F